jgi:hypothetical protein
MTQLHASQNWPVPAAARNHTEITNTTFKGSRTSTVMWQKGTFILASNR